MTIPTPPMAFAEEFERFRATVGTSHFRALVLLGTGQPDTAALLIGALDPERVAILLTEQTRDNKFVDALRQKIAEALPLTQLACPPDDWFVPPGDHLETIRVYQGLRLIIDDWNDLPPLQIAADVTAGLKPMSLGMEKAAHLLGLTTIYIQSLRERGNVIQGSQHFVIPPDPYLVFGDLEAREAQRLYTAHDYASARRVFATLAARVPPPDGTRYAALAALAAVYYAWDAFDLSAARDGLAILLAEPLPTQLQIHSESLQAQHDLLALLADVVTSAEGRDDQALTTLADVPVTLALLGTLHTNALRRESQQDYDTAALLRYRCLELLGQHRLAGYGILTERPDFAAVLQQRPSFSRDYERVTREQGRSYHRLPDRASGLFVGYMLLAALGDDLVRDYAIRQIEQRSEARNKSILAHGFRLITEREYRRFAEIVDAMIDRLLALLHQDRATWEQSFRSVIPF